MSQLHQKYTPSEPCSCDICVAYCLRPGWWTLEEARKAIEAGYASRMMFEVSPDQLSISVKDQGNGFQADVIPNPLDTDNLLKPSGRGIFYIRTFMDEVEFRSLSQGGMEVHMVKRISSN